MHEHKDTWKESADVFRRQLSLNQRQLQEDPSSAEYPPHWLNMHTLLTSGMKIVPIKRVVDLGCGSGIFFGLLQKNFPELQYIGLDYSQHAVEIAKECWGADFRVADLWQLTPKDLEGYDLLHSDALLEVLPDGDAGLEKILALRCPSVLLNRVKNGPEKNHFSVYEAYGFLKTYSYYHNRVTLLEKFIKAGYLYMEAHQQSREGIYSTFFLWYPQ